MSFEDHITKAIVNEIQELIKLEYITDAIEKLFDFIRDFTENSPRHRDLTRSALKLSARHARYQKARRNRLPEPEDIHDIIDELILQMDQVAEVAKLPIHQEKTTKETEQAVSNINQAVTEPQTKDYSVTELRKLFILETQKAQKPENRIVASVNNIESQYRRGGFKLGPVSFELRNGEITGVVGMNASGKTTMLRCLLGDIKADKGTVDYPALKNQNLDWYDIKGKLGYVAQLPDKWPGRLRNNLNFTASAYGLKGADNDELVDVYIHRYGLKAYENAGWDEISGGFKIRFELVRALLTRPSLLVLDEPLAYLDIVTQQIFLHDLRSIASSMEKPIPIIVTSQHLHEIEAIADQMVILDDGKCLYSGPIADMPASNSHDMYEVEVNATRAELLRTLRPHGLVDLEKTSLGWILIFEKPREQGFVQKALLENYGDRMEYYRNITHSTRSLFRNHRDDFERAIHAA